MPKPSSRKAAVRLQEIQKHREPIPHLPHKNATIKLNANLIPQGKEEVEDGGEEHLLFDDAVKEFGI